MEDISTELAKPSTPSLKDKISNNDEEIDLSNFTTIQQSINEKTSKHKIELKKIPRPVQTNLLNDESTINIREKIIRNDIAKLKAAKIEQSRNVNGKAELAERGTAGKSDSNGMLGALMDSFTGGKDGFVNIKPLVNLTINALGLFDGVDLDAEDLDPHDTKTVLKSIFQIWNPKVKCLIRLFGVQ